MSKPYKVEVLNAGGRWRVVGPDVEETCTYLTLAESMASRCNAAFAAGAASRDARIKALEDALKAIAGWASDNPESPLYGKDPIQVSEFAANALKKASKL